MGANEHGRNLWRAGAGKVRGPVRGLLRWGAGVQVRAVVGGVAEVAKRRVHAPRPLPLLAVVRLGLGLG